MTTSAAEPGNAVALVEQDAPILRGLLHAVACPVAALAGVLLADAAPTSRDALALLLLTWAYALVFAVSTLYHLVDWSPTAKQHVRQLDHSAIFVCIATTYTSLWLVALEGWIPDAVLIYVWLAAALGVGCRLAYSGVAPSTLSMIYVAMGLVELAALPALMRAMSAGEVVLVLGGSFVIGLGSIAFARGRPNPIPGWVGYHEVFHLTTVVGAAMQVAALSLFVFG